MKPEPVDLALLAGLAWTLCVMRLLDGSFGGMGGMPPMVALLALWR